MHLSDDHIFSSGSTANTVSLQNTILVPDEATEKEKSIHKYLDELDVYQINVERYLDEGSRIRSDNLSLIFQNTSQKKTSSIL